MANHTAAERERINKKHKRERVIIEVACVLAIAVFIFVCERKQWFSSKTSGAAQEALATEQPDMRLEYMNELGIADFTENGDELCVNVSHDGTDAQLIVGNADGPVTVTYIAVFEPYRHSGADIELFPNSDDYFDEDDDAIAELCSSLCDEIIKYLAPLVDAEVGGGLARKLHDSLLRVCSGESQNGAFLLGIYTVEIAYSTDGGTLRVEAEPSH